MRKITLSIEGMSCGMCEAHVNDAIRASFKVKSVTSSHSKKNTVIIAEENIDPDMLNSVVTKAGYTLKAVTTTPYEKKGLFSFFKK